jgi:diguanylate cyclase (GGDEF)-like protein
VAGVRVLIIDDDEGIRLLLSRVCRREGMQASAAADAFAAYDQLALATFDVIICDLDLPGLSGIEILRHARHIQPQAKVIILTGHGDLQTAIAALRLGAFDYLQKPLEDLALIPLTISRAVEQLELERANSQLLSDIQLANREIERRRHQQIESLRYLGQALTDALQPHDVARVILQAIHSATACDAVGMLLLPREGHEQPQALISASDALTPCAQQSLVEAMRDELERAGQVAPVPSEIDARPEPRADGVDAPWRQLQLARLAVRETVLGVAIIAQHGQTPFDDAQNEVFGVLATQGAIALDNAHLFVRMQDLATKDSLTGLYNHGHFFELLEAEISRSRRYGHTLAVIMLDIDRAHGLKQINDTHGHLAGDAFLCHVAKVIQASVRRADSVARYGGDEFVVLAPQTDAEKATTVAERLCRVVRESPFAINGSSEFVTVSVGAAVYQPESNESASGIVSRADRALYAAKDLCGNQVVMAPWAGTETLPVDS